MYSLKMNGLGLAVLTLAKKIRALDDISYPLERIAADFYRLEDEWFHSEGGGRWKPLAPAYAAWKQAHYGGKKILRRTDAMYREFTGRPGHRFIRRDRLQINVIGVDYWRKHQEGDPKTRLPARDPMSPAIEDRRETWDQWITEHIRAELER